MFIFSSTIITNDTNIKTWNSVQLEDEHLSRRLETVHKKEQKKTDFNIQQEAQGPWRSARSLAS